MEVAYEWLPDFCPRCHNLGHDVINCRWLYTRKENKVSNENVVKGKTKVPSRKLDWVPVKENPSRVGFQSL